MCDIFHTLIYIFFLFIQDLLLGYFFYFEITSLYPQEVVTVVPNVVTHYKMKINQPDNYYNKILSLHGKFLANNLF